MPNAEIIAIGTELLLGEIPDTNTSEIAKLFKTIGLDIFRAVIIGDNEDRIAEEICSSLNRADIIITTGGLGPTIDDPTRNAVAKAFNCRTVFHEDLWEEIKQRFKSYGRSPSENNRRQAYLPESAQVIHNPVGTAPAFYIKTGRKLVFSLPGVPLEMITLLNDAVIPIILREFQLGSVILTRTIHTAGIGESSVDELIYELEQNSNPTVGLAAHPGQVDIRITAKAKDLVEANLLIQPVEDKIKEFLGPNIFGFDHQTLHNVVINLLHEERIKTLIRAEEPINEIFFTLPNVDNLVVKKLINIQLLQPTDTFQSIYNEDIDASLVMIVETIKSEKKGITLRVNYKQQNSVQTFQFGGHPLLFNEWLENLLLNQIRLCIINEKGKL